jgi:phosphoribosylglycinamide formyltransferase-1
MKKIVVLISGSGSNLQAIIDKCNINYINAEVVCVISNNPNAFGIERAKSFGIKTIVINHKEFQSRELFDEELYKILLEQNADLIVLAGFMRILTEKITNNFFGKIINIHPSLLPKYPGKLAWEQALADGAERTGCTVHFVDAGMDTGEVILRAEVPILQEDTPKSLHTRIQLEEYRIYPKAVKMVLERIRGDA